MSVFEQCVSLLREMDETALQKVESYIRFIAWESQKEKNAIEEDAEDDAYCEALYQKYLKDPDRGESESLEDVIKELGIDR